MSLSQVFMDYFNLNSYAVRVLPGMGGTEVVVSKNGDRGTATRQLPEYQVALIACASIGIDIDPPPPLDFTADEDPGPPLRDAAVRHDWLAPYDYIGVAVQGSSENAPVWRIRRIAPSFDGQAVSMTATNAVWTNREAEVYV